MAASLSEVLCFGRYEPLFRVAAGGMAEVYAARIQGEAGFQKLVAVKRMLPHLASDAGFVDMFLNEAKLAAYVASPHVVQTLDLGRGSDGSLYIVMELVVGLSLAKILDVHFDSQLGPLPLPVAIEVMAQAAQGLDDAHEATTPAGDALGLIHRDVSPHNILLGVDGRVRVTDFGIARAVHRPRAETNVRELKGKFSYMSPEQTRLKDLDKRSDVFSIGTVLWELLTARRLFMHRDPIQAVRLVQKKPIVPPHELRPEVPRAISAVVLRALERDVRARYQSAGELALDLRRAARESWGEPPQKRELAQFVERSGGEELERLQRLIRLGTEGAAPEAIEAVQPGVTRVLSEDSSGVALLGTGARRTSVLDSDVEDEDEGPPTVMIVTDEVTPSERATAMAVRTPEADADLFEDETPMRDIEAERTDPSIALAGDTPLDPPTTEHVRDEEPPSIITSVSSRHPAQGATTDKIRPSMPASAVWIAGVAIFTALSFGVGSAIVLLLPGDEQSAVLPISPAPLPAAIPPIATPVVTPPTPPPTIVVPPVEIAEAEPPPALPPPEAVAPPEASAPPEVAPETIAPRAEAEPRRVEAPRRRRRSRTERAASPAPAPVAEPPRRTGTLLGVQDFDRRSR
jgi:serine/threonine-protein kinase